jgi:ABC-type glycerol-3-phosphate transport system permease component
MTAHIESSSGRAAATVRRRPMSRRRRRQRIVRAVGIYSGVAMMSIWVLLPLYFTIASSFMRPSEIGTRPFHWIPHEPTLKNYQAIIEGNSAPFEDGLSASVVSSTDAVERLIPAMGQSVMIGLVVVVINLIVGGTAAYAISRYPFRGAKIAYLGLLASRVVPAIAIISPFFVFFRRTGLLNTSWALIISYLVFTLPLSVWLLKSYFDSVPVELEEAAKLDGASRFTCLLRIVIPIARPGLVAAGLLVFLEAWSEFFYALVLTNQLTTPTVIAGLQNLQQFSWTTLAAASMFSLIPPIVLALVFQRYIVSGLARGSVK